MSRKSKRKIWAIDCETDPFEVDRIPEPFLWGAYDGEQFLTFDETKVFVEWFVDQTVWLYAHNGGKFDFIFLMPYLIQYGTGGEMIKAKIINGRLSEMPFGKAKLRDSWSIIPTPLADFQKTEIDYGKMEKEVRAKHMPEITSYLRDDCVSLFELVTTFRNTAGSGLTIAGNALSFARKLDINVGRSNRKFDKKFRPFYYGGRCEALHPGIHKKIDIYDIKSAYPFAMMHKHPTGTDYVDRVEVFKRMSDERLQQCFIILTCHSEGAFPVRSNNDLSFPHDKRTFYVTGWEYVAAKNNELISDVEVHHCYEFYEEITFTDYVEHWFANKEQAEKDKKKALRHVCKIMLNSLYGKLCQNPVRYMNYRIVEALTPLEEGWNIAHVGSDYEIHARSSLYELQLKYGEEWENFSVFYNVATGASITGFCRAMLLNAINRVGRKNALYCDTDSVIVRHPSGKALDRGDDLGEWGWEGYSPAVYIAGRKLYAANLTKGPKRGEKIASKGVKLSLTEIKRLCKGEEIEYKNPAPTFKLDGSATFITRKIKRTSNA